MQGYCRRKTSRRVSSVLVFVVGCGDSEFEEGGGTPLRNCPVGSFEVCGAGEGVEEMEVMRGEEEGVCEGVAVEEKGGGEGEVGVEGATGGGGRVEEKIAVGRVMGDVDAEGGVEAGWLVEGGREGRGCVVGEDVMAGGKREECLTWSWY